MIKLLRKYLEMSDEEKNELCDLALIHEIEIKIKEIKDLEITLYEEMEFLELVKSMADFSNINPAEIIARLLDTLNCTDIEFDDLI